MITFTSASAATRAVRKALRAADLDARVNTRWASSPNGWALASNVFIPGSDSVQPYRAALEAAGWEVREYETFLGVTSLATSA